MTVAFDAQASANRLTRPIGKSQELPAFLAVCVGMALVVALGLGKLAAIWTQGAFFDSDDAMRLVQVRDFLGGQAWFDLSVARLAAPTPMVMHWSRIVDVPLAALIWLFSCFAGLPSAERMARIVFPLSLYAGLLASMIRFGRTFFGDGERLTLILLAATSGLLMVQFAPGRIDHHAPQIMLLVLIGDQTLGGFDLERRRAGLWTGLLSAASMAISLENLPFILAAVAIAGCHWIWAGAQAAGRLRGLAVGMISGAVAFFVLTVAPSKYGQGACDAFSSAHLIAMVVGGALCWGLTIFGERLQTISARACAATTFAAIVAAVLHVTFPACLGDPLAAIDPVLRDIWLSHVLEARSLRAFMADQPELIVPVVLPVFLGVPAVTAAIWLEEGVRRAQSAALLAFILVGCATAIWQVRALSSLAPFSILAGAWCAHRMRGALRGRSRLSGFWAGLTALPFCAFFWVLFATPVEATNQIAKAACLSTPAFAPLGAAPVEGPLLGPIDMGSHILALTAQRVVAAPYHRNNSGNRLALDFFLADPEAARHLLVANKIHDVVICPAMTELEDYAARAPSGMAALLVVDQPPRWLKRIDMPGPLRLFRLTD